jgi:hypothetical protein
MNSKQPELEFGWGPGSDDDGYSQPRDVYVIRAKLGSDRILCLVSLEVLEDHFPRERPWNTLSSRSSAILKNKFREMARKNEFLKPIDPTFFGLELILSTSNF